MRHRNAVLIGAVLATMLTLVFQPRQYLSCVSRGDVVGVASGGTGLVSCAIVGIEAVRGNAFDADQSRTASLR